MKTAADYRIEEIATVYMNGAKRKSFRAYIYDKDEKGFVFLGAFTAPAKTANKNLWTIANNATAESEE